MKKIHVDVGLRTKSGNLYKEKLHGPKGEVIVPIAVVVVPPSVETSSVGHLPDAGTLSLRTVEELSPGTIALAGPGAVAITKFFSPDQIDTSRSRMTDVN